MVGNTIHIGRGAGGDATSSAVISDIFDAIKYLKGEPKFKTVEPEEKPSVALLDDVSGKFYIRLEVADETGVLASIAKQFAQAGISIESLMQRPCEANGKAWLLLTTHDTTEGAINEACKLLRDNLSAVTKEPFLLRIM